MGGITHRQDIKSPPSESPSGHDDRKQNTYQRRYGGVAWHFQFSNSIRNLHNNSYYRASAESALCWVVHSFQVDMIFEVTQWQSPGYLSSSLSFIFFYLLSPPAFDLFCYTNLSKIRLNSAEMLIVNCISVWLCASLLLYCYEMYPQCSIWRFSKDRGQKHYSGQLNWNVHKTGV